MNKEPLISIITVVFNGETHLQQTINSVKNQTYKNIEYIIIDGGSKDNTLQIINQNKSGISKWISEPDNGLYDAMNKGISIANGVLIGMINSDDWYELDAVESVVNKYIEDSTKRIFHADRRDIYSDGTKNTRVFSTSSIKFKYFLMTYNHPSMFISKEEYSEHKYNIDFKVYSDYQFVLEAFLSNKDKFVYIDKTIVNYRLGGVSGQISLIENLKEGFRARRNSGMNLPQSLIAIGCKIHLEIYKLILKK